MVCDINDLVTIIFNSYYTSYTTLNMNVMSLCEYNHGIRMCLQIKTNKYHTFQVPSQYNFWIHAGRYIE